MLCSVLGKEDTVECSINDFEGKFEPIEDPQYLN